MCGYYLNGILNVWNIYQVLCRGDDKDKVVLGPEEELLIQVRTGTVSEGVCLGGESSLKNQR